MKDEFITQLEDGNIPPEDIPFYKPYFIRKVFHTLRYNMHLLEKPDYKHLYDECLEHLFRRAIEYSEWNENERARCCEWIEFMADINSKHPNRRLSLKEVEKFLILRKCAWAKQC